MSAPRRKGEIYGWLALIKLFAIAQVDPRLTPGQRRVLVLLGSYAGQEGKCYVTLKRIADQLGVTRQAVQAPLRALERTGYISIERRRRRTGADGANGYIFNLERGAKGTSSNGGPDGRATADRCTLRQPPAPAHAQPSGVAHKKPPEETLIEETSATRREEARCRQGRAPENRTVSNDVCQQEAGARQPPIQPRIAEGQNTGPPVQTMEDRIAAYNLDRQHDAGHRLSRDWLNLDPQMGLLDWLGEGCDKVSKRARDLEAAGRGRGCRYIAGAIENASGGKVTAAAILSGHYAREIVRRGHPDQPAEHPAAVKGLGKSEPGARLSRRIGSPAGSSAQEIADNRARQDADPPLSGNKMAGKGDVGRGG